MNLFKRINNRAGGKNAVDGKILLSRISCVAQYVHFGFINCVFPI